MALHYNRHLAFNDGPPPENEPLQVLCEDGDGTYVLPFLCECRSGSWHNLKNDKPLAVKVVGWRARTTTSKDLVKASINTAR